MRITLGGQPVQCALAEAENLHRLGLPAPADFPRANSLLNPLGEAPARGWFLMLRQGLAALNLNALLTLGMADDFGNAVLAAGLVVAREPTCLTPSGNPLDPGACLLVEVADARWRCHNPYYSVSANKQYNVRAPGWGGQYYEDTLNAGAPWTWDEMLGDLWGLLAAQLGAYPGLPAGFSPDGVPERYRFLGVSAWRSLCAVLEKLGCAVAWNATAGTYSIVQIGAADAVVQAVLTKAAPRLILDRQMPAVVRGRVPAGVRIHFHRVNEDYGTEPATEQDTSQFTTGSVYTVDVAGPAAVVAGAEPGTYHPLWDDLPALFDALGNVTNAAALTARAQTRADAFYATIQGSGGGRLHRVYSGIVAVSPSASVRGVVWRQDVQGLGDPEHPGGLLTEIVRTPWTHLRVADSGQFEEALADSSALRPPDLRVKEPVWPDLLQMIRVTANVKDARGAYPAVVEARDADTNVWVTRETCKLLPANGEILTVCRRYPARLVSYDPIDDVVLYCVSEQALFVSVVPSQLTQKVILSDSTEIDAWPAQSMALIGGVWTVQQQGWFLGANGAAPDTARHLSIPISCATLKPPDAPALAQTPGGTLENLTYYTVITFTTPRGETPISPEASLTVDPGNLLKVTAGSYPNATSWNVYVGETPGSETLQASGLALGSTWTEPDTGLIAGAPPNPDNPDRPLWSAAEAGEAWIKVTSATPSTVTLPGGATITAFPAVVDSWDGHSASANNPVWAGGAAVWFRGANGETPVSGTRYQSRPLGVDSSGKAIWGAVIDSGGALSLKDKLGVVVDVACTSLVADVQGVLTWHNNSPGSDTILVAAATPTQYGVVTTIAQEFQGAKTFDALADFKLGMTAEGDVKITDPAKNFRILNSPTLPGMTLKSDAGGGIFVINTTYLEATLFSNPLDARNSFGSNFVLSEAGVDLVTDTSGVAVQPATIHLIRGNSSSLHPYCLLAGAASGGAPPAFGIVVKNTSGLDCAYVGATETMQVFNAAGITGLELWNLYFVGGVFVGKADVTPVSLPITVGSTPVNGGTPGGLLFNNGGTIGEATVLDGGTF